MSVRPCCPRCPCFRVASVTLLTLAFLLSAISLLSGCNVLRGGGTGQVSIESIGAEAARMDGRFSTAIYRNRDLNAATVILSDLSQDQLMRGEFSAGQVVCIQMFWQPKAGLTPVDATATNCTIRDVIVVEDGVLGVYAGAGFLVPQGKLGDATFAGSIRSSTLTLDEDQVSAGFQDRLGGIARLQGSFSARLDPEAVDAITLNLNGQVSAALGRMAFVVDDL